jgi:hypothetical protein
MAMQHFFAPPACPSMTAPLPTTPPPSSVSTKRLPTISAFASYEAVKCGAAKFLVWYNDLKDANTFYTKATALKIMAFLDANSGGLHTIDMILLRTNMHQYYIQADNIPQYIILLEDAQKKTIWAGMPIADIELVMIALAAVLTAIHLPRKVDDWEGLPSDTRMWMAWTTAFRLAHLIRQCQILALGGGASWWGSWHVTLMAPIIGQLKTALNNLALAATNDSSVLQQLTVANLALKATITLLTATNKVLVNSAAISRARAVLTLAVTLVTTMGGGIQ